MKNWDKSHFRPERWWQRVQDWWAAAQSSQRAFAPLPAGKVTPSAPIDYTLLWLVLILLVIGLVMVYSASIGLPDTKPKFSHMQPTYFLELHAGFIALGLLAAGLGYYVPTERIAMHSRLLLILIMILMLLTMVPFLGRSDNGAQRWLQLLPGLRFQPSELCKLVMVIYTANYVHKIVQEHFNGQPGVVAIGNANNFWDIVSPIVLVIVIVGSSLLQQNDMGAFLVVAVIMTGILFLGGVNLRMCLLVVTVLIVTMIVIISLSAWRSERVGAWLDPFGPEYRYGKGFQITHALMGLARGGLFGAGLGAGIGKLQWQQEPHNDFLFAVIGEEWGLLGLLLLITIFYVVILRMIRIGREALMLDRTFAGLVAQGIGLWLGVQALIHMGVNVNALPTKGLTLPLMSYGGTALVTNMLAVGLVLRIDRDNRLKKGGHSG